MRRSSQSRRIWQSRSAAHASEAAARPAEELFKVFIAALAGIKRCARRDDAELFGIGSKPESVKQHAQKIGDLRSSCSAICVQFIDNEVEDTAAIRGEPGARLIEDSRLNMRISMMFSIE